MSTKSERWDYLNRLGEEYYGLVQQGYGATLENRCQRQIDIASKLVASVVPFLNKIAGENFKGDVRGGINFNIIKSTHDQTSYELEVLDEFLDKVTINNNTKTVYNINNVRCGTLADFLNRIDNKNRKLAITPYKNYFGGKIWFQLVLLQL